MVKKTKRTNQGIPIKRSLKRLDESKYGFLATVGNDGEPYVVALNFIVMDDEILLPCAPDGKKIDNMLHDDRVCFRAAADTETGYVDSEGAIICGKAYRVEDPIKKKKALYRSLKKYFSRDIADAKYLIDKSADELDVWAIAIDHMAVGEYSLNKVAH